MSDTPRPLGSPAEQRPPDLRMISGDGRPLLIVNADDFGLTDGVCRGVLTAHERGVVTSTSALVIAPAFDRHAVALRDSGIAVGAHLAVVGEDPPLLAAREIPSLVDRNGRFPLTWRKFLRRAAAGRVDTDDLRRELGAQLEKLVAAGVTPSHLDSHQNLHLWPQVATAMLDLASANGIGAIRLCRSSRWDPTALGVRSLSARLAVRARRTGLVVPEATNGLDETGSFDQVTMVDMVRRLAGAGVGSAELVIHLGEDPDPLRARYVTRFEWGEALRTVCDPAVRGAIDEHGFRLGSFRDLSECAAEQPRRRLVEA